MINPLVFAHNRHAVLIDCLRRSAELLAQSERFAVYLLAGGTDKQPEAEIVVVHRFGRAEIDNNIGYFVANELLPLLNSTRQSDFEHLVGAIVRSIDIDERYAWHLFYDNSLAALERAIAEPQDIPDFIWPFGAIYNQVLLLAKGQTLLDVGACFGFLPLIYARRQAREDASQPQQNGASHEKRRIVGCDLDPALMQLANDYVRQSDLHQVEFVVADLLAADAARLGTFDMVTCLHMLEHLAFDQTMPALTALWQRTGKRLIICVPLEEIPDPRFGHQQVFDAARLHALGQELGGSYRYFEHHGGWLVVDRL
ncbi:MAG: class I SAM-dependent methyltransferase [Chloroflexales bacterium]|nr:class I SAM-dependent methyltransferase [Chloroflexales bacterium]